MISIKGIPCTKKNLKWTIKKYHNPNVNFGRALQKDYIYRLYMFSSLFQTYFQRYDLFCRAEHWFHLFEWFSVLYSQTLVRFVLRLDPHHQNFLLLHISHLLYVVCIHRKFHPEIPNTLGNIAPCTSDAILKFWANFINNLLRNYQICIVITSQLSCKSLHNT